MLLKGCAEWNVKEHEYNRKCHFKNHKKEVHFLIQKEIFLEKEAKRGVKRWIAFPSEHAYFVNLRPNSGVNCITKSCTIY